jgi:hypothetical protein
MLQTRKLDFLVPRSGKPQHGPVIDKERLRICRYH